MELYDPRELNIAWVVDFPLLGWNEDEQRWDAEHHPFCYPVEEDLESLTSDPGAVRAQSYDLICNGYEAGSGSIRIHDPVVQQQVFDLLGIESPRKPRCGSASCSKHSATVPRRTGASPWDWIAG